MPYVAQRVHTMWGVKYGPPGNIYDLPHIVPSEAVERLPFRRLKNLLDRRMLRQVEVLDMPAVAAPAVAPVVVGVTGSDFESDPRVENEGYGWFVIDGKRTHGRAKAKQAFKELGG